MRRSVVRAVLVVLVPLVLLAPAAAAASATPLPVVASCAQHPCDSSGRWVVSEASDLPTTGTGLDIMGYDMVSRQSFTICALPAQQLCPRVDGDLVAWLECTTADTSGFGDIYGAFLDPATDTVGMPFPISGSCSIDPGPHRELDVSGDIVVWINGSAVEGATVDPITHACSEFTIATLPAGTQLRDIAVSGDRVVWSQRLTPQDDADVYTSTVDPLTHTASTPSAVCAAARDQVLPAVDGTRVVWMDYRPVGSSTMASVRGLDLSTNKALGPFGTPANAYCLDIKGRYVLWSPSWEFAGVLCGYNLRSRRAFTLTGSDLLGYSSLGDGCLFWAVPGYVVHGMTMTTSSPKVTGLTSCSVRRGTLARLSYRVTDPDVASVTIIISVLDARGAVVRTVSAGSRKCGVLTFSTLRCSWPRSTYHYRVTAWDTFANPGSAQQRLVVR
jgi:hypothetical protein